ncbi:MAG: tetratricopeptide repeat protein, partial [Bacteroidetes bacterium]|nr:tetratricopeptide repeat protein [Bacteroidota bacterium]
MTAIISLCEQYNSIHPDTLLKYYNIAEDISAKENNHREKIDAQFYKAVYFFKKAAFDSARQLIDRSVRLLDLSNDKTTIHKFLLLKSGVLIKNNEQKESIENSLHVLQSSSVSGDTLSQLRAMVNVGWGYMELGQNREALKWFWDAARLDDLTGRRFTQAPLYSDMASVYNELNKNDSAEIFVKRSMAIAQQDEDLTRIANACNIYADVCIAQKNNTRAEVLLQEGLRIRELIGDPFYIVSDIYQLGVFYAHN